MSKQSLNARESDGEPYGEYAESDLDIFRGMEGFEESDDSLVALLDDLHEDTLMTLLDDNLFVKELCQHPFDEGEDSIGKYSYNESHSEVEEALSVREYSSHSGQTSSSSEAELRHLEGNKRLRSGSVHEGLLKKAKLDGPDMSTSPSCFNTAFASVIHDHCYTATQEDRRNANTNSDEASNEEGNSSDTGYDTMSSSTSPRSGDSGGGGGTASLDPLTTPAIQGAAPCSTRLPLSEYVDPVALIDERIKHYMCSREVNLTEEEKEILKAEGLPIPTTLPLTKVEERALKNVRRKIRNRAAAQESRKRKKELMHTLEDRVSDYSHENIYLKKRVQALEIENKSLVEQLERLQAMISSHGNSGRTKVGTCIMVIILCFAVFYGGWSPHNKHTEYATSAVRSRSLLSVNMKLNFPTRACDWFKQIFMMELEDPEFGGSRNHQPITGSNNLSMNTCPLCVVK